MSSFRERGRDAMRAKGTVGGTPPVDLIKELRLRRWARDHYAPPELRMSEWHPVVLDEMAARDRELAAAEPDATRDAPVAYVPLMPDRRLIVHAAHAGVPRPVIAARGAVEDTVFIPG